MTSSVHAGAASYPEGGRARDRWILERRGERNLLDPFRPYGYLREWECSGSGEITSVSTIFLTNRECRWRCVMCDLWRNTLTTTVPLGAIPAQIDYALEHLPPSKDLKLYNSGSFFDSAAIPFEDYPAVAARAGRFARVVVESHPGLLNENCLRFRDLLHFAAGNESPAQLEVAMGLETIHPRALPALNKRMTIELFSRAAAFLRANDIALRAFILVQPPFIPLAEALTWVQRTIDFAFHCHAAVVSLIPTRPGNGAMDELLAAGQFQPPPLGALEDALDYGLSIGRGRVYADLWDLERFSDCDACFELRSTRLAKMNLSQTVLPRVRCPRCELLR